MNGKPTKHVVPAVDAQNSEHNHETKFDAERHRIETTLKLGLTADVFADASKDEQTAAGKLRVAREIARGLLVAAGLDAKQVNAWLVSPGGGAWKKRVAAVATKRTLDAQDVVELLVKRRRRQPPTSYSARGRVFNSARELYDALVGAEIGPEEEVSLSYGRFVQLLASACGAPDEHGVRPVDIDLLLVPSTNTGSRDASLGPIRVVGPGEDVSEYPNAARLYDGLLAASAQKPEKCLSRRSFNARVQELRKTDGLRPTDTLLIALEDAASLLAIDRRRLPREEVIQRLADYELEHDVKLAIPMEEACCSYSNNQTTFPFRCPTHLRTYKKSLAKFHQGCPDCGAEAGIAARRISEEDMKQFVEVEIGAKLLTPYSDYVNNCTPLELQSPDGLIYWRSIDGLRRNPFLGAKSVSELCVRLVVEAATGKEFKPCSPAFAKGLYLDLHNEETGITIEYDGPQHTKFTPKFHADETDLVAQQQRDLLKDARCTGAGGRILRASYTLLSFANPDLPASERGFVAADVIRVLYDWLFAQNIGITLRPSHEVIESLAPKMIAAINSFRVEKWRTMVEDRNGEFMSRDPGTGRIEYRCRFCDRFHTQGSNNMHSGYIARDCENTEKVKAYMTLNKTGKN